MTVRSAKELVAQAAANVTTIEAGEAAKLVGASDTVFVDVREANELEKTGTVKGAISVPRGVLEFQADPSNPSHKAELDPTSDFVLFCASGGPQPLLLVRSRPWASRTSSRSTAAFLLWRRQALGLRK